MLALARTSLCVLVAAACGGTIREDGPLGATAPGSGGTANNGGMGIATPVDAGPDVPASGGTPAFGGSSDMPTCPGDPVTFQIVLAPNSATGWCLGEPGGCADRFAISDASGPLYLGDSCNVSCETGEPSPCRPTICRAPYQVPESGVTETWDGTYHAWGHLSDTSGADAGICVFEQCASRGSYTVELCGFPLPDPAMSGSCAEVSSSTPPTCVQVSFEYPAASPVIVAIPG